MQVASNSTSLYSNDEAEAVLGDLCHVSAGGDMVMIATATMNPALAKTCWCACA